MRVARERPVRVSRCPPDDAQPGRDVVGDALRIAVVGRDRLAERGVGHEQRARCEMVETPGMGSVRLGPLQNSSAQGRLGRHKAVAPNIRINPGQPRGQRFGGRGLEHRQGQISVSA